MLGKIVVRRRKGQKGMRWLEGIIDSMEMSLNELWEIVKDRKPGMLQSIRSQSQTQFSDQTTVTRMN